MSIKKLVFSSVFMSLASVSFAANNTCGLSDVKSIQNVILVYVAKNTAIATNNVAIQSEKCVGSYASAIVHPIDTSTDDAKVYLHKSNKQWAVIAFGSDFDEKQLDNVPQALK